MYVKYKRKYFASRWAIAQESARVIVPLLQKQFQARSVVDFGCATGIWLSEFRRLGVARIFGIDGPWVPRSQLLISEKEFEVVDFSQGNIPSVDKYDIALCIEVAEHLSESRGKILVDALAAASDVIVFSAAVPGQRGRGHINERLQSFWCSEFEQRGFACFDLCRPAIWDDYRVNVIYKQNLLIFVSKGDEAEKSLAGCRIVSRYDTDRIHPDLFKLRSDGRRSLAYCRRLRHLMMSMIVGGGG